MAIEKVIIQNFKKFKNPFEVKFNENINLLVGDNESGKSTILEAIHVALTGMYAGRNIRNQLSTYLFNREAVEEYLASVENGQPIAPPEIMIELYFKSGTLPEYEGNGNSEKSDGIEGIRFTISFSDKFNSEYESLLKTEKIISLPIEFYEAKWFSFSRDEKMPRFIPIKSVMIDSSNYRYQNGSDVYISRVVKDFLEPEDITAITQAHRNMIDEFAQNEAIQSINEKISAASTVMNGKLSLSADQGVQNSWESSLVTQVDGIPFAHAGKGAQCIIKTQLALSHKQAEKASIILIEEPESHLSFSRLSELMGVIEKAASGRQIIASTHSSFVANKLGLENLILLSGDNCCSMQSLKKETFEFFKKVAGYDTLRLILCKKSILVEGDSDELVVQRAYMDTHEGRLPIQDGIDVMTVGGVTFKRYLEIAQTLNKETAVVTDNDGNIEAVKKKYKEYEEIQCIHICVDEVVDTGDLKLSDKDFNYNTLEPKILKENGREAMNNIFGTNYDTDDEMHKYMHAHKTDCAIAIFESATKIKYPEYIMRAIKMSSLIIAAAGAGKTTFLVKKALEISENVLITTYTDANEQSIRDKFYEINGCIPSNVTIMPWFLLLIKHGIRPYQSYLINNRVSGVLLVNKADKNLLRLKDTNEKKYVTASGNVYSNMISKLPCVLDELSNGCVFRRIRKIFSYVFVDEIQDFVGYDLEVIKKVA